VRARGELQLAALAALAMAAATAPPPSVGGVSVPEPSGFWTGPINSAVPASISGGKVIHTKRVAALLKEGSVVVVDVSNAPRRPENMAPSAPWLPLPHHAIPGAIWIPGAGLGEPPPSIDQFYHDQLARLTANDPGRAIIVYCHERCWLSWNGAKRAIRYGYRNVYWFPDGIEGWRKAKLPTAVVQPEPSP
jgi:PQQ-dependent catabolism-associated CXXCW motif protein